MQIGKQSSKTTIVNESNIAKSLASGDLDVFSTPSMIALMEHAAAEAMTEYLAEGESSVGTKVDIAHIAATPLGMQVTATAEITGADGRMVYFKVWAEDECGLIGEGTHTRAVIDRVRFMHKVEQKSK